MEIKFAEVTIFVNDALEVTLSQPSYGDEDQIISFPCHQAQAICAAIMETAAKAERLVKESAE